VLSAVFFSIPISPIHPPSLPLSIPLTLSTFLSLYLILSLSLSHTHTHTLTHSLFSLSLCLTGARDGAAHLDQIKTIKSALPHITIIANGNVCTYEDCLENLVLTNADGIMSAEGLLDDPALFIRKKTNSVSGDITISQNENVKKDKKEKEEDKNEKAKSNSECGNEKKDVEKEVVCRPIPSKLSLALEYLELVDKYPVKMKSVIFHIRRICREEFTDFQLMEDCVSCKNSEELKGVVKQALSYKTLNNFIYDKDKEKKAKEILEKRKREEGKRKLFEERMIRKAKREKKENLHFYLSQGAQNPSIEKLAELKKLPKEVGFEIWKNNHSQHCYNFHFEVAGCHRDRTCSFLHHDPSFVDDGAVAYG
jgi:tRNA-dihydrouridine synthase 1